MDDIQLLVEKQKVIDVITDLFVATDQRDWTTVRNCFAPQVMFDMHSLTGTAPGMVAAKDIVSGWEQGLAPLRAVHHQAGNFKVSVEGNKAVAFCYAMASHFLPNPSGHNTRVFVGSYDFELKKEGAQWRITMFRFNLKYVEGNLELEKSA
jgi:hypothetical protein